MLSEHLFTPCRKIKVYQTKWAAWAAMKATVDSKIYENVSYLGGEHIISMATTSTEGEARPTEATCLAVKEVDSEESADYEVLPAVGEIEALVCTYAEVATSQPRENRTRAQQTDRVIYDDMIERLRVKEGRGGDTSEPNAEIEFNIPVTANKAYAMVEY